MAKKIALGKGIASLINQTPNDLLKASLADTQEREEENQSLSVGNNYQMVDIDRIKVNPGQPRKTFKEKELRELSTSIEESGILQPLIVSKSKGGLDLIAGERRLRAAKMAGLKQVPVVIKSGTERDKMMMAIVENIQRSNLNCVEEALAYYRLLSEYRLTQEEVAKKLGKERSSIANFLRILKLPHPVLELLQNEELSFGHGKLLAGGKEEEMVVDLARRAVKEELSVRQLEKLLQKGAAERKSPDFEKFDDSLDQLRLTLEEKTGLNFAIRSKKGRGEISIKFTSEEEFNGIYDSLLRL